MIAINVAVFMGSQRKGDLLLTREKFGGRLGSRSAVVVGPLQWAAVGWRGRLRDCLRGSPRSYRQSAVADAVAFGKRFCQSGIQSWQQ